MMIIAIKITTPMVVTINDSLYCTVEDDLHSAPPTPMNAPQPQGCAFYVTSTIVISLPLLLRCTIDVTTVVALM